MATYFVISDIHSFYNEMIYALNEVGYDKENKNHILINLGDLFDRGPDSIKCLDFINSIPDDRKVCIRGNHEDLLQEIFYRGYFKGHDIHNKTFRTVYDIAQMEEDNDSEAIKRCANYEPLKKYLDSCIDYFETDKYVFVHGWIPSRRNKEINRKYDNNWRNGDWVTASWDCCFDAWHDGIVVPNKTIVAGHWHTSYGHYKYHNKGTEFNDETIEIWNILHPDSQIKQTACFDIFKDKGIIGIDACTVYSKQVNVLKIGKQKPINYWRNNNE